MNIVIVIKSLGILFTLIGIAYLLKPGIIKKLMEFFKKDKRIYLAGLVRFVLAVVFFVGARECRYSWVIFIFGILFLLSGLLIFMLGPEKIRRMLDWYGKQPSLIFRIIALVVIVVGAVIIFSA